MYRFRQEKEITDSNSERSTFFEFGSRLKSVFPDGRCILLQLLDVFCIPLLCALLNLPPQEVVVGIVFTETVHREVNPAVKRDMAW